MPSVVSYVNININQKITNHYLGQEARRDELSVSLVEFNFQTVNISY